ncbi:MAG: hypothetical protein HYZ65_00200, partial [Burkholderiales bacterium]|nr:hypothetical protein [Burkholderiales bacterium]
IIVETVSNIEIANGGGLLLRLANGGRPSYQYVYRAAAGVYWDQEQFAFKLAARTDDDYAKWFAHILKILEDEMGLQLRLSDEITWINIPDKVKEEILSIAI